MRLLDLQINELGKHRHEDERASQGSPGAV